MSLTPTFPVCPVCGLALDRCTCFSDDDDDDGRGRRVTRAADRRNSRRR